MSRFYASIQGTRGMATRLGHKQIEGHIRGWNVGVRVTCYPGEDGEDVCSIMLTGGSNGHLPSRCIGTYTKKDLEGGAQ